MKEVTLSLQGENSPFRSPKITILRNHCESYLNLIRKYICIIPFVLFYLTRFRFVSFRFAK